MSKYAAAFDKGRALSKAELRDIEIEQLRGEIANANAVLATERELRQAAESYIDRIPAMCKGDFSAPCALHVRAPIEELFKRINAVAEELLNQLSAPIPMRLHCPECHELHIDVGEFATKVHHTHACQNCGNVWRPAVVATVGVRFLPGFRNDSQPERRA